MRLPLALSIGFVLLAAGSAASSPGSQPGASASAYGIKVIVPGQAGGSSVSVAAPPNASSSAGGFSYGSAVTSGSITASASTAVGTNVSSTASSEVSSLSLFGGEVAASSIVGSAKAGTTGQTASGDLTGASVGSLTVGGAAQAVGPNARVALADWGYAITLEQAEVRSGSGSAESYRGYVTALDIHVTVAHGGLPAGSQILVGYAEAWVQAGAPPAATPPPPPPSPPAPKKPKPKQPQQQPRPQPQPQPAPEPKPGNPQTLAPTLRQIPVGLQPKLTAGGYVFPVYGPSSFTDTFGAFRGDVSGNWHHGDDIFAPLGAPVLACAEGTIFSVGWNDVGGNRLWLRDGQGNEFYYAHLSAYSPAARNGNHVKAGEVVGFVGNTGDAQGTPYHLHFEVHPVAYLALGYDGAVDPTPYLVAWKHQKDLYLAQVAGYLQGVGGVGGVTGTAPKPGAILLQATDISEADGLDPASLRRALFAPVARLEGGRVIAAEAGYRSGG